MGLDRRATLTLETDAVSNPLFAWVTSPPDLADWRMYDVVGGTEFGPYAEYGGVNETALAYVTESGTYTRILATFDGEQGNFPDRYSGIAGALPTGFTLPAYETVIPAGWPVVLQWSTGETWPSFDHTLNGYVRETAAARSRSLTGGVLNSDQELYFRVQSSTDGTAYWQAGFPHPQTVQFQFYGTPGTSEIPIWVTRLDQGAGTASVILGVNDSDQPQEALIPVGYRDFRFRWLAGVRFGSRISDEDGVWSVTRVEEVGGRKAYLQVSCERALV